MISPEEITKEVASQKDALLWELFKKHGYHRAKVMKLVTKNRISSIVQGNITRYLVDGKEVFAIEQLVVFDDDTHTAKIVIREVE